MPNRQMTANLVRRLGCAALLGSVLVAGASSAGAQVIGAYVGPGSQRTDGGKVVGVSFNSYGQTISSLGFYDFGGDGLATSYQVGLWDASQTLIASATVTPASPLIGDFRYAPIAPVTIGTLANPATFTIGAVLPANLSDVWLDNIFPILWTGFAGAGTGQYTPGGSLVYPGTLDSSSYYVVNAGGPIPEPAPLLLLGSGTALLLFRRRQGSAAPTRRPFSLAGLRPAEVRCLQRAGRLELRVRHQRSG